MNSNGMDPHGARLSASALTRFAADVYRSVGVPEADAWLAADTMVKADLWGHQSHGLLRLGWYVTRIKSRAIDIFGIPEIVKDSGAVLVMDGKDALGPVITMRALEESISRAKTHGVCVTSVRNSNHFGTCMYYTRLGAEQGCVMLLMSNAGPNMAPWGGLKKMIGTNPWSISAPAGKHGVAVMDMANSGVARGKIYLADKRREMIPADWAIDKNGCPTTDPREALEGFILPMAGHKGYVMGCMVDILSGVLSGSQYLDGVHGPYDPTERSGAGHFMVAIDVNAIQALDQFNERMEDYIRRLKNVPLAQGHEQIFFPGEMENVAALRNEKAGGILLPEDTITDLLRIAAECGVTENIPFQRST